jgi:hypothetical protein
VAVVEVVDRLGDEREQEAERADQQELAVKKAPPADGSAVLD